LFNSLRLVPLACHFVFILRKPLLRLALICAMLVVSGSFLNIAAQTQPAPAQGDETSAAQPQDNPAAQNQAGPAADAGAASPLIHVVRIGRGTGALKNKFAPPGAHLTYWGGPVISNIHAVAVFWGPNVNPAITGANGIDQFFTDITSSKFYDLLTEYSTVGVTSPSGTSSSQSINRGQFDGKFTITPSLCPGPAACTVSDAQIRAELSSQINAGHLPTPVSDSQGIIETFYMIYFPPGVTINAGGDLSCVIFCAYHSNTSNLSPSLRIPYGVLPDFASPNGCSRGCGGGTLFQNVTAVTSHEMSEAVTDVQVGSATITAPPLAWYDPNPVTNPNAEVGDICNGQDVIVNAGGNSYAVQQQFSNVQNDCVTAPPVFNLTAPVFGAGPALPFNAGVTIQSSVAPFTLSGYTGTVHFTSSDPQAILPADYTFTSGDAGTHTFSITLKTLGDQTITATDARSSGFTGSTTVNVNVTPDLTIAKTHAGNFFVGQTGALYAITVSNTGHGPTVGAVTVTDNLPGGLSATAIGGTGWSCTLGTLTCTRSDALAAGNSYPAITLTVNVAANAPSLVTNTAAVSGGGETNTANDTASDPTIITAPDMIVSKQHAGVINGCFFQGETGATYTITAINNGNLASSGTITVVDTLPAAGLTATAISGTGWTCTLNNLTCTRSDPVGPNSAYPPITVTADVALDAPANVVNTATISGGGEVNTGNNVSQDLTIVLPPPTPDVVIGMSHFTTFVQGLTGSYQIGVSNIGTKITSGTITVADTLPAGLTATSISGTGWSCTLATLTCTRSDALDFNLSYPAIVLNVNIAPNAPSSVTNTATVSGGNDANLNNNVASDPTFIAVPLIDLSASVLATNFAIQGQTNLSASVLIFNRGNIPSTGTVTVVATLDPGLTATAISGTGWTCTLNNLTCTRSDALAVSTGFPNINFVLNAANNAPAAANVKITASGGGDGDSTNNIASATISISPMVSINAIGAVTQTVTAGATGLFQVDVNPQSTAGGPANLSCSGLPTGAFCSFNPPSVSFVPGGTVVNLTIRTTARTAIVTDSPGGPQNYRPLLPLLLLMTASLAAFSLRHRLVHGRLKPALALSGLLLLAALSGCGGGGGGGSTTIVQNPQGTPAGTYSVTVTATSPNGANSTAVTLVVK
jgi:uncharacterized repeat protein (TIGR01451 family)